jgi:predicted O-methyltransferase YrrM
MQDFLPWLNFPTIEFLKSYIKPEMTVFEYGSGFSTLFFARRAKLVNSIESSLDWHGRISTLILENDVKNVELKLCTNLPYFANEISNFKEKSYDLILVDSRDRAMCLETAVNFCKNTGIILLDNSERDNLKNAKNKMLDIGFNATDFGGNGPMRSEISFATVFFKSKLSA